MPEFLQQLQQRHVVRAALIYAAAVWALAQGIAQLSPVFGLSPKVTLWFVIACVIGFPFWIAFAWFFRFTPHGIAREDDMATDAAALRRTGHRLDYWIIGILAIAVVLLLTNQLVLQRGKTIHEFTATAVTASPAAHVAPKPVALPAALATVIPAKSVAVLPFENLSASKANAYFADGVQDLILTKLADIGDLKVIARTSTESYGAHPENLTLVGKQLGVATILEGSVQKAGKQVLINVQLIDARTDSHVWAKSYQRTLTNIFGVEGEVADKVAEALNAKLTQPESARMTTVPTQNPTAYDAYLRGLMIETNLATSKLDHPLRDAQSDYAKAVKLDPDFALAWAHMSYIKTLIYSGFINRSPSFLSEARHAADVALRLQPDLGEGYLVLAQYYYLAVRNLDAAIPPLNKARALMPNSAEVLVALSDVEERQGKWKNANAHLRQAAVLEPRTVGWLSDLAANDAGMRKFAQARAALDRALVLAPGNANLITQKAATWQRQGNLHAAQKLLDSLPATSSLQMGPLQVRVTQAMYERNFNGARAILKRAIAQPWASHYANTFLRAELAAVLYGAGRERAAHAMATPLVGQIESLRQSPADDVLLSPVLAYMYTIIGNKQAALREARRNVVVHSTCSVCKPGAVALLAQIQARFGDIDAAMAVVPHLLVVPNGYTAAELRLGPLWDPLRKDPRFQALLKKYGTTAPASASTAQLAMARGGTDHQ